MTHDDASSGPIRPRGDWPDLAGRFAGDTHILPVRVYYEDTDFSGVVYHAGYLRFLERGRTDSLRLSGVGQGELHAGGEGLIFAVRRITIDYHRPALMDDVLEVRTRTEEVRGASLVLAQRIVRGQELIVSADVRVAAIAGGRPARIPDGLRQVLEGVSGPRS
ncbi:acyl-CoA thioester hydrolase [Pseudochelatococcus lubricantis]|uniref:Acyl-CoA thioester hydrolase n=1 Tax=Pseudochelatococcus lubricantis TaxID=1538102 RepID=A0ABX0V3D9_9HYPH|nr:tol-pal system-associated acyl-CoA thioesterase [Pseudochelatococcus lubricantis]NIJ59457.1 acyl-CoA thioester hydrolase [Pseudochelatococcus lubricantis]